MREYKSVLKNVIPGFIDFMTASQRWNHTYEKYLSTFDRYLSLNYPDSEVFIQEMADGWCQKSTGETVNSNLARTNVVVALIRYMNKRGLTEVKEPDRPKPQKCTHLPHAFTADELKRFFYECDHINVYGNRKDFLIRKLILCVIFRLMYCTGIRPNEARQLKRSEVDLENGVLNIVQTKGHDQHYVAIHESMVEILREYDRRMDGLIPGRTYFFPKGQTDYQSKKWLQENYAKVWNKANPHSHSISYDFRHHYATANINRWIDTGFGVYDKLYYLSKSMGHCSIEHTKYYYSIVPQLADILNEKSSESFDELMPEVLEDEVW